MWTHVECGWKGEESALIVTHIDGVAVSAVCPQCGGDWPFFDDDTFVEPDAPEEVEYVPRNRELNEAARHKRKGMWS